MTRATLSLALGVLLASAVPAAALTPTLPADGATVVSSHPLLQWSLDGHQPNTVAVSRQQRTTPAGEFFDEDRETGDALADGATSWQPTSAVPAGTYWWSVEWYAVDYSTSGRTAPRSFTIPARVRFPRVGIVQYGYLPDVDVTVSWWSNTRTARVDCRLHRGRRVVSRRVVVVSSPTVAARNSTSCTLYANERWDGERLRVTARVSSGKVGATAARAFTAR